MTTREIIKKYLEDNKYDGLFNVENECSCLLNDLMPCGECDAGYCKAGVIKGRCKCSDYDPEKCDPDWTYCMKEKEK